LRSWTDPAAPCHDFLSNRKTYNQVSGFLQLGDWVRRETLDRTIIREQEEMTMPNVYRWITTHALTVLIVAGTVYAIAFVIAHRKALFYKE
jgi:hypothetical protein